MTSGRPDVRFYEPLAPATLGELSGTVGARLVRGEPESPIGRVAILAFAGRDSVTFATDRRHLSTLADTGAGACFLPEPLAALVPEGTAVLVASFPQAAYAAAAKRLHRPRQHGADESAIHPSAELEEGVEIGADVSIGPGATIGRGTRILPGAVIGPGVSLGRDCYIGPNAIVGFTLAGDRVSIYAGAAIGEAGFGATATERGVIDIPQLGRVILQDGVTIGANSCVDRGGYDDTVIGENTKIDNLIQIGHNCVIGRNCVLASQCGISGSVTIGDGCQLGGRVGIADHITVGSGVRLAANTGLIKNVPAGETWGGFPAKPVRQWLRESAWLAAASQRRGNKGNGE